ncbi:hypothetical protein [Novosphingobium sp.]|uniref:hypothetical protein n=1 Tax=Novosphingobium sp. TaxID=1874826 RepID=UPI001D99D2E6|nr:hypothetical protein [Novosphingobium sp.]MBX9663347.1 hypothetical protein [Novosphingobium sp.]
MRPHSIIRFEQLYLGGTAISLLTQLLNVAGLLGRTDNDAISPFALLLILGLGYGLTFLFWYLIARRASNLAKWVLVVITALSLVGTVPLVGMLVLSSPLEALLTVLVTLLQVVAVVFLFRPDAARWLRSKGQDQFVDISTFN